MSDDNNCHGSGMCVGLAFGIGIGIVLGFLYAPKPGNVTRRILKEKANEVCDRIRETRSIAGAEGS